MGKLFEELAADLRDNGSDSAQLERTEERLGALRRLKRLCNIPDENELLSYCDEIYTNLEWLEASYTELEELNARSLEERKRANALAMEIRHARQEAAKSLTERVNAVLGELAMGGITFGINFEGTQKLSRTGADSVEFTLTEGSRSGRVEKIASGGELSRLCFGRAMFPLTGGNAGGGRLQFCHGERSPRAEKSCALRDGKQ